MMNLSLTTLRLTTSNTIFKANKGVWRMPRHKKAMKDVVSCDKLRVVAYKH